MKILITEWHKTKRTPIRWVTFLVPIFFAAIIVWYFSVKTITTETEISIFQVFFEVWTALVIPLGAGLISGLMVYQEELAGSFRGFLGSKLSPKVLYLGKLTMLILLALISTLFAVLILLIGLSFILNIHIAWPIFILSAIIAILSALPLLVFHLWISFSWGMSSSIGIASGGILIAALMATSLGNRIWQFVPWAWPVRLTRLTGAYLLYLPYLNSSPEMITLGLMINKGIKVLITSLALFVILLVGSLIWIERWEGRRIND